MANEAVFFPKNGIVRIESLCVKWILKRIFQQNLCIHNTSIAVELNAVYFTSTDGNERTDWKLFLHKTKEPLILKSVSVVDLLLALQPVQSECE